MVLELRHRMASELITEKKAGPAAGTTITILQPARTENLCTGYSRQPHRQDLSPVPLHDLRRDTVDTRTLREVTPEPRRVKGQESPRRTAIIGGAFSVGGGNSRAMIALGLGRGDADQSAVQGRQDQTGGSRETQPGLYVRAASPASG
jgi:hypothetical protein